MKKQLILITGAVLNSSPEMIDIYNDLILLIDKNKYDISSPIDTMNFLGTDDKRYERSLQIINDTSLMIAEMSNVSTGQGMEIQQAANKNIPILVIAKKNSKISGLVKGCPAVKKILFYETVDDIKDEIKDFVNKLW